MSPINARFAGGGLLIWVALSGCALLPTPTQPPAPDPPPPPSAIASYPVWSARPNVDLEGYALPRPFTRLEVLRSDSIGLYVRCEVCEGLPPEGSIPKSDVVSSPLPPEVAAWGGLAEFALAIRAAAARLDLDALRPAMISDFSFSFVGQQSPDDAFAVWRAEDYATLVRVPELLDQGLSTVDERIWSAPPAYAQDLSYRGPRIGFRQRPDGRWEWLYLIQGIVP